MNISLIEVRNRVIRSIIHSYPIITQPNRAYVGTHPLSPLGKPAPRPPAPPAPRPRARTPTCEPPPPEKALATPHKNTPNRIQNSHAQKT